MKQTHNQIGRKIGEKMQQLWESSVFLTHSAVWDWIFRYDFWAQDKASVICWDFQTFQLHSNLFESREGNPVFFFRFIPPWSVEWTTLETCWNFFQCTLLIIFFYSEIFSLLTRFSLFCWSFISSQNYWELVPRNIKVVQFLFFLCR